MRSRIGHYGAVRRDEHENYTLRVQGIRHSERAWLTALLWLALLLFIVCLILGLMMVEVPNGDSYCGRVFGHHLEQGTCVGRMNRQTAWVVGTGAASVASLAGWAVLRSRGIVNRGQRIAIIAGVVIILGAAVFVSVPFNLRTETTGLATGPVGSPPLKETIVEVHITCRAPIFSAFENRIFRGVRVAGGSAAPVALVDRSGRCRGPAKQRLFGSAAVIVLVGLGVLVAVRIMRSSTSSPTRERSVPAHG